MKILILSNYPWDNNNSFGNTYSSIFGKVPDTEIAHIYMFDGTPDPVDNIKAYYQIPERDVMKSVFKRNSAGKQIEPPKGEYQRDFSNLQGSKTVYAKLLSLGKRSHWSLLFFARELGWKLGRINYDGLMEFVRSFQPDLFFLPYSNTYYTNRIAHYIKCHYDVPMVMEMAMDHYSFKRVSWNPFFWIDRIGKRRVIRRLANESEEMFVISQKLKEEMERSLGIPCRILYKTPDSSRAYQPYTQNETNRLRYLFTGNIYANRWKSLAMLAEELKVQGGGKIDIYTASPISKRMEKVLNIEGVSEIHPPVNQEMVIKLQNNADVLVHVEAFDKYNKSLVRCAISTKIMDYLSVGRCILAIGPSDISSIEYLHDNKVALIADNKQKLKEHIVEINSNRSVLKQYAERGRDFTVNQLDENKIRIAFYNELQRVINNYNQKQ